jgi:membrane protease YdiL (CAAX protease family)
MDTIAIPYLFSVLCLAPALGVFAWDYLRRNKTVPKNKRYTSGIALQAWLFVFTMAAASAEKIDLFSTSLPSLKAWVCGAVFLVTVLLWARFTWARVDQSAKQRLRIFLPETPKEFLAWVPVAIMAGLAEECAYRGAAYDLLRLMGVTSFYAVGACTIAFAVCHLYQGWRATVKIGILGLVSQAAVFLTGSLYVSIAVHAAYDLLIVWLVMQLLSRDSTGSLHPEAALSG